MGKRKRASVCDWRNTTRPRDRDLCGLVRETGGGIHQIVICGKLEGIDAWLHRVIYRGSDGLEPAMGRLVGSRAGTQCCISWWLAVNRERAYIIRGKKNHPR